MASSSPQRRAFISFGTVFVSDHVNPESRRRLGLPKRMRLKTREQFDLVYATRMNRTAGPLIVYARPNDAGYARLGLSVSRRLGGAVERNRFKRLLREAFRRVRPDLPGAYDVVINLRPHEPRKPLDYQRLLRDAMEDLHQRWSMKQSSTANEPDPDRGSVPPPAS
jgi:ribonuclease P protein component